MTRSAQVLAVTALLAAAAPLAAQDTADPLDRAPTAVQITPYLWLAGFGGDIRPFPGGPDLRVSKSFGELLEDLDAALFVAGLVRIDRFVAVSDISHTSSSREGLVPTGNPAAPVLPAEGRLRQTSWTLAGGYRVVDQADVTVDLLAGFRAWWLRASVAVPAAGVARAPAADFVDPIAMARVNWRFAPGWSLLAQGDFGGLGAGSEFTAQTVTTVNARVAERIWLSAGYRYLVVDWRDRGARVDARLGGPLMGASFIF